MKPTIVISSPVDTYSGYGARSRDFVKAVLKLDKYNVKLLSQRWGNTRFGYLNDHKEDELYSLIIPNIQQKPDIWVQITVPNEFQPVGKYNIGVTAGIEATIVDQSWIQGVNRMDLTLTSSVHSKEIFQKTVWEVKDNRTKKVTSKVQVAKPIEVLLEGADLTKYFKTKSSFDLSSIKESFCFLVVGHWLKGDFGHDRKDIGFTVKSFLETFKNKPTQPALVLKTSHATTSLMDKSTLVKKIESIKSTVKGKLPNIYVIHGDLSDSEINEMYNHPKVKAMVSLTRGEGFGRPLLEFTTTGKPVIAPHYSGPADFLNKEYITELPGGLTPIHPTAQNDFLIGDAKWFTPDYKYASKVFKEIVKHYNKFLTRSRKHIKYSNDNFSSLAVTKHYDELFKYIDTKIGSVPIHQPLNLPSLNKIELPKLKTV